MPADFTVLHCVPSLHPNHGGPSRTVVQLTDALARYNGFKICLLSQGARVAPTVSSTVADVTRRVVFSASRITTALSFPIRQELNRLTDSFRPTLVHSHGVWRPANHWAARAADKWRVPLVIHPRGMLEPWALGQKALKKRLALALFQRKDLEGAQAFVATSEMEYENLRRFGIRQPIAVIPNGVQLTLNDGISTPGTCALERERVALFLSRVHPKKGVLELVRAWSQVAPVGWRLCIAGPDEGGHWREVSRLAEQLGFGDKIEYLGPVEGTHTTELYQKANLFVLPTFSENFGVVVAEALAQGVPVITTRAAPWADLESHRCGWWIETGVEPLTQALREAIGLSDAELWAMGQRGREYVRRYDWDMIAEKTIALYRWLLERGERPECVHID